MPKTNRHWLPGYCHPQNFIPRAPETRVLFYHPPYYFPEFVGKAIRFLTSDDVRKMGFEYDPRRILPCTWKCADETMFLVGVSLYAYTGVNPFHKGVIGAIFNEASLAAAVHHGPINLDFGGSHVGYEPGEQGGVFGRIWRPQHKSFSADCGRLTKLITPFVTIYQDACRNILLFQPEGQSGHGQHSQ